MRTKLAYNLNKTMIGDAREVINDVLTSLGVKEDLINRAITELAVNERRRCGRGGGGAAMMTKGLSAYRVGDWRKLDNYINLVMDTSIGNDELSKLKSAFHQYEITASQRQTTLGLSQSMIFPSMHFPVDSGESNSLHEVRRQFRNYMAVRSAAAIVEIDSASKISTNVPLQPPHPPSRDVCGNDASSASASVLLLQCDEELDDADSGSSSFDGEEEEEVQETFY